MDSSHVGGGVVVGQLNIQQATIYNQTQGIPQGWYNPLFYIIEMMEACFKLDISLQ